MEQHGYHAAQARRQCRQLLDYAEQRTALSAPSSSQSPSESTTSTNSPEETCEWERQGRPHIDTHTKVTHATRSAAARADASPHDSRLNRSRIGPIHRTQAPHQHLSQHYPRTPRSLGCPPHSNARAAACLHPYPHTSTHVHASSPTPDHADATHLTLPTTCPLTYPANNTD